MSTYARELEVATRAAREAGEAILAVWNRPFTSTEKSDGKGPLTEADLAANAILLRVIGEAFPHDGILSEETADTPERLDKRRCWILDPLDGTKEFTLKIPEFCVSVGFTVDGEPVVGALFNPATGELVAGEVGVGATLNGAPIRVSARDTIAGSRLLVSRTEMDKGWFKRWEGQVELEPMGSVAWKFALVAAGRAEASFTPQPRNEWDLCGGVACILAAGGQTSNGNGEAYVFNRPDPLNLGVCGTNGALHAAVMGMMRPPV